MLGISTTISFIHSLHKDTKLFLFCVKDIKHMQLSFTFYRICLCFNFLYHQPDLVVFMDTTAVKNPAMWSAETSMSAQPEPSHERFFTLRLEIINVWVNFLTCT